MQEIQKFIETSEDSKKGTIYKFKNFEVDYIVVGVLSPGFQKRTVKGGLGLFLVYHSV